MKDYKRGMTGKAALKIRVTRILAVSLIEGELRHRGFAEMLNNRVIGLSRKRG